MRGYVRSAGPLVLVAGLIATASLLVAVAASPSRSRATDEIAIQIAAGEDHTCILTNAGGVKCVGNNDKGQLGDGSIEGQLTPVSVAGMDEGVEQVAVGGGIYGNSCALKAGAVFCWGSNEHGQLATGDNSARSVPVPFAPLPAEASQVSVGEGYVCSLLVNGGVWCAGDNSDGQLGAPSAGADLCISESCSLTPIQVTALPSTITAISAGDFSACALDAAGQVYCWGSNVSGALGTGTEAGPEDCDKAACSRSPVLASLPGPASSISVGTLHACAVVGGAPYCWGDNLFNETSPTDQYPCHCVTTPTKIDGIDNVVTVSAGAIHECFLTTSNDASCMGANNHGQLGVGYLGSPPCYCETSPQEVAASVLDVSAYGVQTCLVKAGGVASCAGADQVGQLGDDTYGEPDCRCRPEMTNVVGFGGTAFCSSSRSADATPTPLCPTVPPSATPFGGLRGDADCDGVLDTTDAMIDLKVSAGLITKPQPTESCFDPGDMNCDYRLDGADALLILRHEAGDSSVPVGAGCYK